MLLHRRRRRGLFSTSGQAYMDNIVAFYDWRGAYAVDNLSADGVVAGELAQLATGGAFLFDGLNDYVDCGNDASLRITGALTMGCWFKTADLSSRALIAKYTTTGNNRSFSIAGDANDIRVKISSDGTVVTEAFVATGLYADDIWHHVVGVYTPLTAIILYVDGKAIATNTTSIPASIFDSGANADFSIGAYNSGALWPFDGELAGAFVYAAAASAADVLHCYNNPGALPHQAAGSALTASDLKGHWPMTEGLSDANFTLVLDHSGNGNHGTNVSGGATPLSPAEEGVPQTGVRGFTRGIRFDGVNDIVTVTSPSSNMRTDFTWGIVLSRPAYSDYDQMLSWFVDSDNVIRLRTNTSGTIQLYLEVAAAVSVYASTYNLTANEVAYITLTHDVSEKTITFYVNGSPAGSQIYSETLPTSGAVTMYIATTGLSGIVDEVSWFDTLFDGTEVSELYNSGDLLDARLHSRAATLIGYWRNGWLTPGISWKDLSSNSNDGYPSGTPDNVVLQALPDDASRTGLGGFTRQLTTDSIAFAEAGHARLLGPHLVINGGFADATGWTVTSPWSITGGLATIDGSQGGNTALTQAATFVENDYYEVAFDVIAYTAGTVTPSVNGTSGTGRTAVGRYTEVVQAGASGGFVLTANSTFDGSIDNVYARRVVLPDLFAGGGTIAVWIQPISMGGNNVGRVLDKTGWRIHLDDHSSGACDLRFWHDFDGAADGQWTTSSRELTLGAWAHVAVVYDSDAVGNNPTIYVDGVSVTATEDTTPVGSAVSDAGSVAYLGNDSGATNDFDGDVGRLGFHDAELSASDVQRIFESERGLYGI